MESIAQPQPTTSAESHPVVSLISACFWAFLWLLNCARWTVAFITITLPYWLYSILSYSLTLTLNFYSLLFIFIASAIAFSFFIRFKYLNRYEGLKEPPLAKPDAKELHPDVNSSELPPSFHHYLDDFLQAIRVFGFLEKPVFHELARHLQTRRLIAGDSLSLDSDKSFYCVIDGTVQVFARSSSSSYSSHASGSWDDESMNGYELLNEVGAGGTLSSLFTILSLFTEDVKMSWDEDLKKPGSEESGERVVRTRLKRADSDVSSLSLGHGQDEEHEDEDEEDEEDREHLEMDGGDGDTISPSRRASMSSTNSTIHGDQADGRARQRRGIRTTGQSRTSSSTRQPHATSDRSRSRPPRPSHTRTASHSGPSHGKARKERVLRGTVARATEDTTLAVIPAEAFRRLTKKFPKSSAHIVQVILTRFSRVTFNAAHRYLGLTSELLRTEKAINDLACHPLPGIFYEGVGLERLRGAFEGLRDDVDGDGEGTEVGIGEEDYFGQVTNSPLATPFPLPRSAMEKPLVSTHTPSPIPQTPGIALNHSSRNLVQAGDLHTSSASGGTESFRPIPRSNSAYIQTPYLRSSSLSRNRRSIMTPLKNATYTRLPTADQEAIAEDDEFELRDEVMACIAKSIGLLQPPFSSGGSGGRSGETSPALPSWNTGSPGLTGRRVPPGGVFNSPFTSLSMLDAGVGVPGLSSTHSTSGMGDDVSSVTGSSTLAPGGSSNGTLGANMSGLDNEIEILFFGAGTTLVKAGERNAGLFYVIDGFLDLSMPSDEPASNSKENPNSNRDANPKTKSSSNLGLNLNTNLAPNSKPKPNQQSSSKTAKGPTGNERPGVKARRDSSIRSTSHSQSQRSADGYSKSAPAEAKGSVHLFTVKRGGIAGYLSALSGIASYVDIKAKTDTYVGFLPSHAMDKLLEKNPIVLLTLAKRLISLLSPLVLHIDSALDWVHVSAGQVLWRPGDISDSLYIVINGRLRALSDDEDGNRLSIAGEYGQGDTVGELDAISQVRRGTTMHAIRDTELARVPLTLFNAISKGSQATLQLLKRVAMRVRTEVKIPAPSAGPDLGRNNFNLKTVTILPVSTHVPISAFAKKLHLALENMGAATSYLSQASVMNHVGRHSFTRMGQLKVAGWLADQEQRYRIVLYVVDSPVGSQWAQTSIRQADYVMVVGMGDDPSIGEYERLLLSAKTTARKELVLLHPDRSVVPGSTREWLKNRPWIHAHFHVELPGVLLSTSTSTPNTSTSPDPTPLAALKNLKNLKDRVQHEIKKYRGQGPGQQPRRSSHSDDFARLARRLCGRSVGVVLGGGGARGISHLGVLRALEEYGIPVDHIAGTSIGAFIGGLYAREGDIISSSGRAKHFAGRMSSAWRILADVTYPIVAYTTGHEFNRAIYKSFYDLHIEDMWLPYFCNTTNILKSRMEVHETGYAWRYIRASMTLAGLLPPLSDNGQLLVDGGYIDNLPVGTMLSMGAAAVFAVDVGSIEDNSPRHFGDSVSGWWLLLNRWNPFSSTRNIPAVTEIQSRLA
ncbi:patatin-domain-containing protein [Sistotremastrum suecicum HHB10207 ss-3]|uniref:Lysophospholipase NTE1 n=1 Tax=Sistotremastrum suecicum HHB10207 ss-3 TaxID=1314776 RepID=A0A166DGQ1_9AGAM|nr:patatin-domain-containing protein [Sistotremastrum suecicum HHB10207 ss-3]